MAIVGGSVAVSGWLQDSPMFTAQALRYALAFLLLVAWARVRGIALHRPAGREWAWLAGVALCGLVLFNVALVRGAAHAEPAVLAVAVAGVPVVLAILGPVLEAARPASRVVVAAAIVTCGAALVQGFGRSDALGLAFAALVLACEAGFTLLALPVMRRHGPVGVSVWAVAIATLTFAVVGVVMEGPGAVLTLSPSDVLVVGYLAVAVTAVAFVLWYGAVRGIGTARAGLLTGVAPVSAAWVGTASEGALPAWPVWAGIALVAAGLAVGLARRTPPPGIDDGASEPAWQDRLTT